MKKNNNKGFTLAELLIVVAIIAVLTAIAIPVFTTQLEKSREATDLANVRSAYAEQMTYLLTWDGTAAGAPADISVPATQTQEKWQSFSNADNATIAAGKTGSGGSVDVPYKTKGNNYTVKVDTANLKVTVQ